MDVVPAAPIFSARRRINGSMMLISWLAMSLTTTRRFLRMRSLSCKDRAWCWSSAMNGAGSKEPKDVENRHASNHVDLSNENTSFMPSSHRKKTGTGVVSRRRFKESSLRRSLTWLPGMSLPTTLITTSGYSLHVDVPAGSLRMMTMSLCCPFALPNTLNS